MSFYNVGPSAPEEGCGIPVLSSPGYDCNGNGICFEDINTCECNEGFTGKTDFISFDGLGCPINRTVQIALWGVNIFILVAAAAKSLPLLLLMIKKHNKKKLSAKESGQSYSLSKNRGLLSVLIYWGSSPFHLALGIWILISPNTALIGINPLPTILWIIGRGGFHIAVAIYQPSLLTTMLRSEREAAHVVRRYRRYGLALAVFATGLGLIALLNVGFEGKNYNVALATYVIYFIGQAIEMIFYSMQAKMLGKRIAKILDESYRISQSEDVKVIKQKMMAVQGSAAKQAFMQVVVYATFGAIPLIYAYHQYFLPLTWINLPILGMRTTIAISHSAAGSKRSSLASSEPRKGNKRSSLTEESTQKTGTKRGSGVNSQSKDVVPAETNGVSIEQ